MVGNFEPTIFPSQDFEIALKYFKQGDIEPKHYQLSAHELTIVVSGRVRMGKHFASTGDGLLIEPLECIDFEALSDTALVCVKWPSNPLDKVLCDHAEGDDLLCN